MPKKELQTVLINHQHNVASNGREYPLKLPRIIHENVALWQSGTRPQWAAPGKRFVPETPAL
jgi:hypothetical protein